MFITRCMARIMIIVTIIIAPYNAYFSFLSFFRKISFSHPLVQIKVQVLKNQKPRPFCAMCDFNHEISQRKKISKRFISLFFNFIFVRAAATIR